ncbi:hypothetical protein [Clostridium perfringens]|uniref:hypothetical protein n=1 Tax=Clostridium perfringens TaxID=1502 RepID=UPI0024BCE6B7|nr:hypothetical protein [Clostridium perfringens]
MEERKFKSIIRISKGSRGKYIYEIARDISFYITYILGRNIAKKSKCYRNVLTLLEDKNGVHTKERILLYIKKNLTNINLTQEDYLILEECIKSSQDIGLDQNDINTYYEFVSYIYENPNGFDYKNIEKNIKNVLIIGKLKRNKRVQKSIIL